MARKKQDVPDDTRLEQDDDLEDIVDSVIGTEDKEKTSEISENSEASIEELLSASAKMVVETCMDIRRGENVLIVCDPTTGDIGQALHEATIKKSERVLLIVMPKAKHHGEEPPTPVSNLMRQQQVVLAPTKYSLTHTKAVRQALRDGARVATMPGITNDMFTHGGMAADFNKIKKRISNLGPYFRRRRIVNVKSNQGTDITFEVNWREWKLDDNGICNRPGQVMNLPSGRVFVFPKEETMNGKIVIDGSWEGKLIVEPIVMEIEKGVVTSISESEFTDTINLTFDEVSKSLNKNKAAIVKTVAEFGFGMNARAKVIGNLLEDQVVRGAAHFILGDNSAYGGKNNIGLQMRGVILKPTIELKDIDLVKDGKIVARRN